MRRAWLPALLLAGCGGYLGNGPAPRVTLARPLRVEIKVRGDARPTVEEALKWVLRDAHDVTRVESGGDAVLELDGKLSRDAAILAGTDCRWRLALSARSGDGNELVSERKEFAAQVSSNVPVAEEKLITQSVVWALERTGAGLAAPPPPPVAAEPRETRSTPSSAELEGSDTPVPTETPAPHPHKKRHHH